MRQGPGRALPALLVAATALGSAGCYTSRFDQIHQEMAEIREELRRLSEQAASAERLRTIEEAEAEARNTERAESSSRHQELLERLEQLESSLGDSRDRHSDVSSRRVTPVGPPPSAETPVSASADTTGDSELRAAYDAARLDLTRGNFDLAATGFREFVRTYPISELADNAQYWLGEAYYAQDQHIEAIAEFAMVVNDYPSGDKVPAAILKMGFSHIALGEKSEGITLLKQVTSEYPRTPEAKQAQEKLRELAAGRGE